jgi:hypothetical protein
MFDENTEPVLFNIADSFENSSGNFGSSMKTI